MTKENNKIDLENLPPMEEGKQHYYPSQNDNMWNQEVTALLPWLFGKGVDVCCGSRSIFTEDVRVDYDKRVKPDYVVSGDILPFEDGQFDYLYAIHALEHVADTKKTLLEWTRVVRPGGIVAIVHPDVEFTGVQKPQGENPDDNPYNEHKEERTHKQFIDWFKKSGIRELEILSDGVACGNWSFFVVFKKKGSL